MTTRKELEALTPYLDGMRAATTADELEAALQKDDFWTAQPYNGRGRKLIDKIMIEEGRRLRDEHSKGHLIPRVSTRNTLTVDGKTYKVGRGGNSTGVRYCWTYAQFWAIDTMVAAGLSRKAAHMLWENFDRYPHRAIRALDRFLAGGLRDPELNVLIKHQHSGGGSPIRYSIAENDADDRSRASRPCPCGGTLFDWGCGNSYGFEFVNWHCIVCPDVFTEYMTQTQLYALRSRAADRKAA